jgi:hypothetical protein
MSSTALLVVELVVLFLGVAFAVEVLQRRLGPERLQTWMGGRPVVAALKGIAVGFVTPFCTYSAVPLLVGLRRAGVPTAGYVAFIVAAPVLDPVLFGALVLIVGLDVALAYLAIAFAAAMTLALVAQHVGIEHRLKPVPASNSTSTARRPVSVMANPSSTPPAATNGCDTTDATPWRGWRTEAALAARSAGALFRSFGPLLLVGVAIGLAIEALVSPDTAARVTGENSTFAIPIAAAIGTPLYFSTELFVPIADSLHRAGVGTGAIVALTIAGAGANIPEFVILARLAQGRLIAIFFGYVFAVASIGGVLAQAIS